MSMYKEAIEEGKKTLERTLKQNRRRLNGAPRGTLTVKLCNGKSYLYRLLRDKTGRRKEKVLKESDRVLAQGIQRRVVLERQNKLIEYDIKVMDRFLKDYRPCDLVTIKETINPVYTKPLNYRNFKTQEELNHTRDEFFYPEGLIHKNSIGEVFRSKGEVQVSEILLNCNVSYTYETCLSLPYGMVRPDFEIRMPGTDELKYIEYCGMMDNDNYAEKTGRKLQNYLCGGFKVGRDVLFLFETGNTGMDVQLMKKQIKGFLNN